MSYTITIVFTQLSPSLFLKKSENSAILPKGDSEMKKSLALLLAIFFTLLCFSGCQKDTLLDPQDPVVLTIWHTYGEQSDSPMNRLIDKFNSPVGRERGIVIKTTLMTVATKISDRLSEAQSGAAGAIPLPDLFFCHNNDAAAFGADKLLDWQDYFSEDEISAFVPDFLADGMVEDMLAVLPVSKSTHVLYLSGGEFDRFSAATGVTYDDLATWDGFFSAAEKYYTYSGGKPFCAFDYLIRAVELYALSSGANTDSFYKDGWYDFSNESLKAAYLRFSEAIARGHIVVADLYSNTQVMTGETPAGMGSSAGILYYNDTVTYPDNTSEPMKLMVCPMPYANSANKTDTQAGVGLCAVRTNAKKAEAASVFAHWLTDGERNLSFAAETGYMPVTVDAYAKLGDYTFGDEGYRRLYTVLNTVKSEYKLFREPSYTGYYGKVNGLYAEIRKLQSSLPAREQSGENAEALAIELWELFRAVK